MDDELNNPSGLTASDTSQSNSSMPPITLPDDYLTDLPPVEELPVPSSQDVAPVAEQSLPAATMQEFAPMPSAPVVEAANIPVPPPKGVPRAPIPPSPVNPAMVPDPLFPGDGTVPRVAVDGGLILPHESEEYKHHKIPKRPNGLPKIIGLATLAILALVLAVGGYFDYKTYQTQENARILKVGLGNLLALPPLSSTVSIKSSQGDIEGTLKIDQSKNVSFASSDSDNPLFLTYLKSKDTFYVGSPETKNYQAYKNAQAGLDMVQDSYLKFALPGSSNLTSEMLTDFKYVATETIDGKANNKYTLSLDDAKRQQIITDILSVNSQLSDYNHENIELSGDIWITKDSPKVSKIIVMAKTTLQPKDSSSGDQISFSLELAQNFDYSFDEDIKLPIGSKTLSTVDAVKSIDDTYGQGAENKAKDAVNISTINTLKKAIEEYKVDTESYPEATDIAGLVGFLSGGEKAYISSELNVEDITYVYDSESEKYVLAFKLNNQEATGTNISGIAPEKVYVLGN